MECEMLLNKEYLPLEKLVRWIDFRVSCEADFCEDGVISSVCMFAGVVTAVHTNGVLVQAIDINDKTHIGTPYIYFADMLEPYYTKEDGVQRAKRLMQDRRCAAYITRHRRSLFALLLAALTFTYVCIFAGIFAAVESIDFGDGLYFAFITVSTVGYGDVVPVSNVRTLIACCQCGHNCCWRNVSIVMIPHLSPLGATDNCRKANWSWYYWLSPG